MKKYIFTTLLLLSNNSFSAELSSFQEIKMAVMQGKKINIVIDFSLCSSNKELHNTLNLVGTFAPETIMISDHIATSLTHFTLDNPAFPEKPVYEFVTYVITPDNQLNVTAQILEPVNHTPISKKISFNCSLQTGASVYD